MALVSVSLEPKRRIAYVSCLTQGVDIVMDPVGASYVNQNIDALAIDGSWVLYGLMVRY